MDETEIDALIAWARRCGERGWNRATSGNFSIVASRDPLRLFVTRTGVNKATLGPEDLVMVDEHGAAVTPGKPSAETHLHLCVVRKHGPGAVGHTHSIPAVLVSEHFAAAGAVAFEGYEMGKALAGVRTHARRVVVPIVENSQDWAKDAVWAVKTTVGTAPGLLIRRHGLYVWGAHVEEAARHLDALEYLLEIRAREVGYSK